MRLKAQGKKAHSSQLIAKVWEAWKLIKLKAKKLMAKKIAGNLAFDDLTI